MKTEEAVSLSTCLALILMRSFFNFRFPRHLSVFMDTMSAVKRKKLLKTPLVIENTAARLLFGSLDNKTPEPSPSTSEASQGSNNNEWDQHYMDQCHSWFRRETRSKTPMINSVVGNDLGFVKNRTPTFNAIHRNDKVKQPVKKRRVPFKRSRLSHGSRKTVGTITTISEESIPTESFSPAVDRILSQIGLDEVMMAVREEQVVLETPQGDHDKENQDPLDSQCAGCGQTDIVVTGNNLFKILANNVGICNRHRLITHRMLDYEKARQTGQDMFTDPFWTPLVGQYDDVPFSVMEDRRLREGVKRFGDFGDGVWEEILDSTVFADMRRPHDLEGRWHDFRASH